MRRATVFVLLCACVGLVISSGGCNSHPLQEVEYDHFTGGSSGTGHDGTSTSSSSSGAETGPTSTTGSSGSGDGTGSDGGTDTGTKFDVGPVCGNGIVEPGEQCDDGDDNGSPPAPCGPECFWNAS